MITECTNNNYVFVHVSTVIRSASSSFSDFLIPAVEEPDFPELDSEESGFLDGGFRLNLTLTLHALTGGSYCFSFIFVSVNGSVPALN